ncbi:MAG: FlgD immunoglobulin-like domain containing protein, partial [Candidatus Neomarinimicrobiota bacterium]
NLNGPSFTTLHSPINFSTPIYDNTVIIGSKYQLRAKIGSNSFEIFDDLQEVTLTDFNSGQKIINGSSINFSSVTGYEHSETAQISALLYDQSGNQSLGDTSAMVLEIDLIANNPTSVNITSNNTNSSYAKTDDIITITMAYDEDIASTSTAIESNNAVDTDLGSEQFKADYTLVGTEPEGVLNFTIDALDYMGNPGNYSNTTNGSQVIYDKTPPELTYVNISSNNADTSWAKVNDSISLTFISNEKIFLPNVIILGQVASVVDLQNNKFKAIYVPTDSDIEGVAIFEIQFSDLAGNDGTPITNSINNTKVTFDKTNPADFIVGFLTPTGGNQVSEIWNLTNTGMDIIVPVANDTTLKNGTVQLYAKIASNVFTPLGDISTILSSEINTDKTISIAGNLIEGLTGFVEMQTIYIKAIMHDRPGNSTEGSQSIAEVLIDETPANISPISIISNNNNTSLAKIGDSVTVSFSTSEALIDTVVKIEDQLSIVSGLGSNQFAGVFEMIEANSEGVIPFEISFIDVQGNPFTISDSTTDGTQVIFDKTKPTLNPVSIISDNSCSSGSIAKSGNIVSISYTASEIIFSSFATVMGDTVSISDLGSSQYKIDYQLNDSNIEGLVEFNIKVTDLAGNISEDVISTSDGSGVDLDLTLPVLDYVHIESNNSYSSIAVLGDLVTLTFEPSEPLSSNTTTMASTTVTASENNGIYSATYIIQDSDMLTGGFLPFTVKFNDCPGNVGIVDSTTSDESFVSIDIGPPEMVSVKIFSSNQDSSWSKIGDSVFVFFVVNEPLKIVGSPSGAIPPYSSLKIGENSVEIINVENTSYQGFYIMTEPDNEGQVPLEVSFYDLGSQAGNDGTPIQATTNNSKVIFDKTSPTITQATFTTNNSYGDSLAKINDIGSINFSLNENLRSVLTQLDSDSISMNGGNQNFSYNYTFSDSNQNGYIALSMLAIDSAGNESDTIINRVYFDKTAPQLSSILEGSIIEDKVYSRFRDSLQLAWSKVELESGIKRSYIGLGSDSGLVDIVNWISSSNADQGSLTALNLDNNSKYFGAIFLEDNVGNISDSIWGDGITIDLEAPNVGSVWDGFLDEDIDYTADSNQLFVRWKDFTDNQSIDFYEAAIGSNNDTINIASWQKSTSVDNIQILGLNLERGVKYFSYLRAVDSAANISSILKSDGLEFDNTPPNIKSIYPLFDSLQVLSVLNNDEIKINFNKPILKFGFTVNASQDSNLNYSTVIQDSGIIISILDILPSYETITVNLDTAIAFNLLNYTDTMVFRSKLWGDLNDDYKISVEDILSFNQNWPKVNTDLGPVSGMPPYLFPSPDGISDLKDLAAFGKMWVWYYHENNGDSLLSSNISYNYDIHTEWEKNYLKLSVPENTYGAELVFFKSNFKVKDFHINNLKNGSFHFAISDTDRNRISFVIADKSGLDSPLKFSLVNKSLEKLTTSLKYKFIDNKSVQINEGIGNIDLQILPDKVNLFQNYPNPFNGETVIKYELPKSGKVKIKIYDLAGKEVFSEYYYNQKPGIKKFTWKGKDNRKNVVSSGLYFFQISTGENVKRIKMILLK